MTGRDEYYNKSKQQGYRARSAYKLKQIDNTVNLLSEGQTVVDLGAAPGGWLQVAAEAVGEQGTVLGVDRQRIDDLEGVETMRGDLTEADTREEIQDRVGRVDVVISDMAPDMTGEYNLDHARSIHLARMAFETAEEILGEGGRFVAKVFDGPDLPEFRETIQSEFDYSRAMRPDASRDSSSELYLVGKGSLSAPVRAGETYEVEIESEGSEGDGVAKVEDYTVFVPETEVGETVEVRIEGVKPRFGFAERVEEP